MSDQDIPDWAQDLVVAPQIAVTTKASPATRAESRVEWTKEMREYQQEADLMRNDITSFCAEGRDIRSEVEGLIVWRRYMGEGSGSSTWGPTQQAHAAHSITYQRVRLAKLKS